MHAETIQPTCLVAEVSRDVFVVVALVLARLEQVERLVGRLRHVVAVLGVVPPTAVPLLVVVVVGVVAEEVAVGARRPRRVLEDG